MEKHKNILFSLIVLASGLIAPYIYSKKNNLSIIEFFFSASILASLYIVIILLLTGAALNIKGPKISTEDQDNRFREQIRYYFKRIEPYMFYFLGILLLYNVFSLLITFKIIPKFWL